MSLSDLKAYLKEHGQATLTDLAHHFRREPELIKTMLEHWIRKGKVEHLKRETCQKGCCTCGSVDLDIYRWLNKTYIPITPISGQSVCRE
jgi:putative ferrous iron transport protein C